MHFCFKCKMADLDARRPGISLESSFSSTMFLQLNTGWKLFFLSFCFLFCFKCVTFSLMCSSWFFLCWLTGAQRQTSFQGTEFQHCCWLFYWETISLVRQALQLLDGGREPWDASVLVKRTSLFSVMWMDSQRK